MSFSTLEFASDLMDLSELKRFKPVFSVFTRRINRSGENERDVVLHAWLREWLPASDTERRQDAIELQRLFRSDGFVRWNVSLLNEGKRINRGRPEEARVGFWRADASRPTGTRGNGLLEATLRALRTRTIEDLLAEDLAE